MKEIIRLDYKPTPIKGGYTDSILQIDLSSDSISETRLPKDFGVLSCLQPPISSGMRKTKVLSRYSWMPERSSDRRRAGRVSAVIWEFLHRGKRRLPRRTGISSAEWATREARFILQGRQLRLPLQSPERFHPPRR